MLESFQIGQGFRDIVAWRVVIGQDTTHPKYRIPALENLRRIKDSGPVIADILWQVDEGL